MGVFGRITIGAGSIGNNYEQTGGINYSPPFGGSLITTDEQPSETVIGGTTKNPTPTNTQSEKEQTIEIVRNNPDLDPNAKIKILNIVNQKPNLTAYDIRVMLATCLYPTAQGLPSPEGYEYFLKRIEDGQTVVAALADARVYFKADQNQKSPSDPNAPDTQDELIKNSKTLIYALVVLAIIFLTR